MDSRNIGSPEVEAPALIDQALRKPDELDIKPCNQVVDVGGSRGLRALARHL